MNDENCIGVCHIDPLAISGNGQRLASVATIEGAMHNMRMEREMLQQGGNSTIF
jgi:hypothetical protein